MAGFDCLQKVLRGIIDTFNEIGEALGVCSPLNNNLVEIVFGFEVPLKDKSKYPCSLVVGLSYLMSSRILSTWTVEAFDPSRILSARSS